jgi:hypothetical protein
MMVGSDGGSPGSHRRNWSPALNAGDCVRNSREGLEEYSDRRMAKLMGWSRAHILACQIDGRAPDDLFEALVAAGGCSSKSLLPSHSRSAGARRGAMPNVARTAGMCFAYGKRRPSHDREQMVVGARPLKPYRRNTDATPVKSRNVPSTAGSQRSHFCGIPADARPW